MTCRFPQVPLIDPEIPEILEINQAHLKPPSSLASDQYLNRLPGGAPPKGGETLGLLSRASLHI